MGAKSVAEGGLSPEQIAARYLLGDPVMFQEEKGITLDLMDYNRIDLPLRLQHKAESQYETWKAEGYNVLKMDNKNKEFVPNLESTRQQLKHLLDIPNTFTILFMQGDLQTQRSGICYNLLADKKSVNVLNTGKHSEQAKIEI